MRRREYDPARREWGTAPLRVAFVRHEVAFLYKELSFNL